MAYGTGWALGLLTAAFLLLTGIACWATGGGWWIVPPAFALGFTAALWLMRLAMAIGVSVEEWRPTDRSGRGRATGGR